METNKKFKCKDEVIYRSTDEKSEWTYGIFSHYSEYNNVKGVVVDGFFLLSTVHSILPYEGNEHLVGTTDEPDEEVRLKKGEWVMVRDHIGIDPESWFLRRYDSVDNLIQAFNNAKASLAGWKYAIRFSDFNPNDMEETKKHILCVKNGKIVKYKD